ncbi:hypothetical protein SynA1562_02298 [Synechococcus sp. A15-62]|nr:hypothetical protein SynA1562_02298 [Synechococcus sp. A15-62]
MNLQARPLPESHFCTARSAGLGGTAQPAAIVKQKQQQTGDFHRNPPKRR